MSQRNLRVVLLALAVTLLPAASPREVKTVAVIGSGIAGAASAKYLRELMPDADIAVFEMADEVGGRTADVDVGAQRVETGAGIIYDGNKYAVDAVQELGLLRDKLRSPWFGIWDGTRLVFESSRIKLFTSLRLLTRYGKNLVRLKNVVGADLKKFTQIYTMQQRGVAFATPQDMWAALGLHAQTQTTVRGYLEEHKVTGPILDELVHAPMKVHYNQGTGLNALAGVISLCPLITGEVFKVREGNKKIVEGLLAKYANSTEVSTRITSISIEGGGEYTVYAGEESKGTFDAVIVATPLEFAPISFVRAPGGEAINLELPRRTFQRTVATWVHSEEGVRKGVFRPPSRGLTALLGLKEAPNAVYLSEMGAAMEPFSSLARNGDLYKLFSSAPLTSAALDRLFGAGGYEVLLTRGWDAYPRFAPPERFAPFAPVPGEHIFYPSALETAVSALEVSAIAARNAALLACQALGQCVSVAPIVSPAPEAEL